MAFLEILLIVTIVFWCIAAIDTYIGLKWRINSLNQQVTSPHDDLVSIIVAAKNEEKQIKNSLLSQFHQTYEKIK